MPDDLPTTATPESISLLIASLPRKAVLDVVKADPHLSRTVFQGFPARVQSLALPFIRDRLLRELEKDPDALRQLTEAWQASFAGLLAILTAVGFLPSADSLAPLAAEYGADALRYALQHDERDDVRAWAERVHELPAPARVPARPAPPPPTEPTLPSTAGLEAKVRELQNAVQEAARAQEASRQEIAGLKRQLDVAAGTEAALQKHIESLQRTLDREQRRARKAEEDVERLTKQLRGTSAEPAVLSRDAVLVREAIALLQQSLGTEAEAPPPPRKTAAPPPPAAPEPPAKPIKRPAESGIQLPGKRGKHAYPISAIVAALLRNDMTVVETIRDGIARLAADAPAREREVLDTLARAGVPGAVLTGPLRPAVVDGSNIANMSHAARGKLAYLELIQRSAWEEGYFPVLVIVDASLRYQIDQPDALMALVEDGRIVMAPPGTAADPLLIEEAKRRNAVLISNDRMEDWPDAKTLDRRKAGMSRDTVRVGPFHNESSHSWFSGKRGRR